MKNEDGEKELQRSQFSSHHFCRKTMQVSLAKFEHFNLMEINSKFEIWPIGSLIHNLPALYAYLNIQ